jgi:hypothetical protein
MSFNGLTNVVRALDHPNTPVSLLTHSFHCAPALPASLREDELPELPWAPTRSQRLCVRTNYPSCKDSTFS